jgi:hypothetical protein
LVASANLVVEFLLFERINRFSLNFVGAIVPEINRVIVTLYRQGWRPKQMGTASQKIVRMLIVVFACS